MKLIVRNTHKYLSFFISIQLLLWTVSGIYFAFNKIENVRGEQYRLQSPFKYSFKNIEFEIPQATSAVVKKRLDKTIITATTEAGMRYFDEEGDPLKKISFDFFIKTYLPKNFIKLVSKLNNKVIVQNDNNFNIFTLKNDFDCDRFLDVLQNYMIYNKKYGIASQNRFQEEIIISIIIIID